MECRLDCAGHEVTSMFIVRALEVGAVGGVVSLMARAAQAAADPVSQWNPGDLLAGGGTASAVAALIWVLKKFATGEFVVRAVSERERELSASIVAAAQREADAMELAEKWHRDHTELRRTIENNNRLFWKLSDYLGLPDPRRAPRKTADERHPGDDHHEY